MGSTDAAGAILSIVASVISNFGVNIQKLAHTKLEAMEPHLRIPYTRMPMWWLGMGMVVAGAIGDFIALGLASQALVAASGGATTMAANVLIAHYWLHEELYVMDVLGVFMIICGAVVISYISPAPRRLRCILHSESRTYPMLSRKRGSASRATASPPAPAGARRPQRQHLRYSTPSTFSATMGQPA